MTWLGLIVVAASSLMLGGCASEFSRAWNAAHQPRTGGAPKFERYTGSWKSSSGAHGGQLECVLSTPAQGPSSSRDAFPVTAYFHAHYGGLASNYRVMLKGRMKGGVLQVRGEQDLGILQGGIYQYTGSITPARFDAEYVSKYDRGIFRLRRATTSALHREKERL